MNTISHKQAIQFSDRRIDGMLDESQQRLLDEHLRSCESCRLYSSEMEVLPDRLSHEFKSRWDKQSEPSQNISRHVVSNAKRIPMSNRLSSSLRLVAGAAGLLLLAFTINLVVSRLQSTSNASNNMTSTSSGAANLIIDPQTCKPSTGISTSTPNELYGYNIIQNASWVDGDFTFDFWLYCDPSLKVTDQEHFSAVSGLGIYSLWRYNGPQADGPVEYYYGFEDNEAIGKSGSDGLLYRSLAKGKFGIYVPEATIRDYIQQAQAIQFQVTVNSSLGQRRAILSFQLQPTPAGVKVINLQAHGRENLDSSLIAFASTHDGNSEIYTIHSNGSGLTNITNNPARDVNPDWSPDGKRIAFESDRNGFQQIYMMNADGSSLVPLTEDESGQLLPLNIDGRSNPWSPDGSKLLYLKQNPEDKTTWLLYSIDINSKVKILLASGRIQSSNLSWSPNGDFVGYVLNESATPDETFVPGINIVKADGTQNLAVKDLVPSKESLNYPFYYWSQDGQSIFFTAYKHINEGQDQWIAYEASIPNRTLIEKATSSTHMQDWWDGTSFVVGNGVGSPLTWLRSDKTYSTLKPLENCEISDPTAELHYGVFPKRAPDGDQIIAVTCPTNDLLFYYTNSDGTIIKQLFKFPAPSGKESGIANIIWSPDSKFVAFKINSPEGNRMYLLNVSQALSNPSLQPLQIPLDEASMLSEPSWQPAP